MLRPASRGENPEEKTYELAKGATVWVEGKVGAMTDIHAGDEVLVTYETRGEHYFANDITVRKRK